MSIEMVLFKALYGYEPPSFVDMVLGDSHALRANEWLQEGQDILRFLKENLQYAQNQQKMYGDKHWIERIFEVGNLVYLGLQSHKQSSLKLGGK